METEWNDIMIIKFCTQFLIHVSFFSLYPLCSIILLTLPISFCLSVSFSFPPKLYINTSKGIQESKQKKTINFLKTKINCFLKNQNKKGNAGDEQFKIRNTILSQTHFSWPTILKQRMTWLHETKTCQLTLLHVTQPNKTCKVNRPLYMWLLNGTYIRIGKPKMLPW